MGWSDLPILPDRKAFFYMLHLGGWHKGRVLASNEPLYLQATTACLSAIIVSQVANAFICRSSWNSVFKLAPFSNRLPLIGIVVEMGIIVLIDYTPVGNTLFGTAPIPPGAWLLMILCAAAMLLLEEFRKWLVRRRIICRKHQAPTATLASIT